MWMYRWLIFTHVLGVFTFLLAHGTAVAISFKLRGERNVESIRALLDLSNGMRAVTSILLLVVLATGIAAGFTGNWWGHLWIWVSLGVLVLMGVSMTILGSRPLDRIRRLLVQSSELSHSKVSSLLSPGAAGEQEFVRILVATRPRLLTAIGAGGLALILWLMMFKPF
jgi:hypothetical protein